MLLGADHTASVIGPADEWLAAEAARAATIQQRTDDHATVIAGLTALGQPDAAAALARLLA